jgi:rhamnulokinase
MLSKLSVAAVDLGASSGRVGVVDFDGERLQLRPAHRFETPRDRDAETGYECWDLDVIEREIRAGLAAARASSALASVGIDGWGVDYVLLDEHAQRIGPAVAYRDDRTRGVMEQIFSRMPRGEIYRRTGIQFQPFNTLYQLAATGARHPAWLERARQLLLLPDYFHQRLGGAAENEYTNATTTQLYDVAGDAWAPQLLELCGASRLLRPPVSPGTTLGEMQLDPALPTKIIAPATHDTASAVAAIPLAPGEAFLISGTWSLMGVESERAVVSEAALRCNVTNEGGVEHRFRVLKNIAGLWLTQRLAQDLGVPEAELLAAAGVAPPWRALVDPDDARFLNPPSMLDALRSYCRETDQAPPDGAGALARCALESLALSYRRVKDELERLLERRLTCIRVGGGGGQNALLNQLTADACELPLLVGPAESSLLGNGCVQLIVLGAFDSLEEARAILRRSFAASEIEPRRAVPDVVQEQFAALTRRRLSSEASRGAAPPGAKGTVS